MIKHYRRVKKDSTVSELKLGAVFNNVRKPFIIAHTNALSHLGGVCPTCVLYKGGFCPGGILSGYPTVTCDGRLFHRTISTTRIQKLVNSRAELLLSYIFVPGVDIHNISRASSGS